MTDPITFWLTIYIFGSTIVLLWLLAFAVHIQGKMKHDWYYLR